MKNAVYMMVAITAMGLHENIMHRKIALISDSPSYCDVKMRTYTHALKHTQGFFEFLLTKSTHVALVSLKLWQSGTEPETI